MLIALGIFVSIMGGFVLNAETVQTCSTEWEHVTDVSGAFVGDRSDMDVEYSPPSNLTGWSWERGWNGGWISGVDVPRWSERVTAYGAWSGDAAIATYSFSVEADDDSGVARSQTYTAVSTPGGTVQGSVPDGFGLRGDEIVTIYSMPGHADVQGAFAAPLSELARMVPGYADCSKITFSVDGQTAGYPCIAVVDTSEGRTAVIGGSAQATYHPLAVYKEAVATASAVDYYPSGDSAMVDGTRHPASDVLLVWGYAKFAGYGASSTTAAMTVYAETAGTRVYLDPALGVYPVAGTFTESSVVYQDHPTSATASLSVAISHPERLSESRSEGTASCTDARGATDSLFSWVYYGQHTLSGSKGFVELTVGGQTSHVELPDPDGSVEILASISGGMATVTAGGQAIGSVPVYGGAAALHAVVDPFGAYDPSVTVTATNGEGSGQQATGTGSFSFDMSYRTETATSQTHSYDTSWWSNGYENSGVTMAFYSPTSADTSTIVTLYGPDGSGRVSVGHEAKGWWVAAGPVQAEEYSIEWVGAWPAIEVRMSASGITATPLGQFTSFSDYVRIGAPLTLSTPLMGGGTITDMRVRGDAQMPVSVVSTVTRIAEGGLYLQDASLDLAAAFPSMTALSLVVGSAAHAGQGITFSSGSSEATVAIDGSEAVIGERRVPLNGLTFRWISPDAPAASIGGQSYRAAIYQDGRTYAAGTVWATTPGGEMVAVMEAPDGFSVTLDGVWAPAVNLYSGTNVASERTELADFAHGQFRWDKNDFVIVMMAVCVAGGLIGSYYGKTAGADWLVIFGAVGVLWTIL